MSIERAIVHPDTDSLLAGIAARMATTIMDVLAEQPVAHIVLTGGRNGTGGLAALSDQPLVGALDFSRVHVWWGDERYLPTGHPDRNATGAQAAMRGRIAVPPTHLHPMPAADEQPSLETAARAYAEELSAWSSSGDLLPAFDLVLLGLGPDGHVASLFPDHPAVSMAGPMVVAVRDAPKPPPNRISLSMSALRSAQRVWLLASGEEKVDAVRAAWRGAPDLASCPGSVVRGRMETLLLADTAAAAGLAWRQ